MPETTWTPIAIATMALAAATLILAIAVAFDPLLKLIRLFKSHPTSTPKKTKAIRDRRPLFGFWLPLAGLVIDLVLLVNELRSNAPLTRPRVLLIGTLAACLLIIPLWMVITLLLIVLTRGYGKLFDLNLKIHDSIEYRLTRVEIISHGVLDLLIDADELDKTTHTKLGPILTELKGLTEKRELDKADCQPTLDT